MTEVVHSEFGSHGQTVNSGIYEDVSQQLDAP
jgi:hypothetical protein